MRCYPVGRHGQTVDATVAVHLVLAVVTVGRHLHAFGREFQPKVIRLPGHSCTNSQVESEGIFAVNH